MIPVDHAARCLAVDHTGRDLIDRPPLEIEWLVSDHARRTVTPDDQARFHREIFPQPVDEDFDDEHVVDPYECHAPSRRSDKELARTLSILDELANREGGGS